MRMLLFLTACVLFTGCAGRWQVSNSGNADAILLDTATGETWARAYEPNVQPAEYYKSYWVKMGPRRASTQP
jgi:hypothetical protein